MCQLQECEKLDHDRLRRLYVVPAEWSAPCRERGTFRPNGLKYFGLDNDLCESQVATCALM